MDDRHVQQHLRCIGVGAAVQAETGAGKYCQLIGGDRVGRCNKIWWWCGLRMGVEVCGGELRIYSLYVAMYRYTRAASDSHTSAGRGDRRYTLTYV